MRKNVFNIVLFLVFARRPHFPVPLRRQELDPAGRRSRRRPPPEVTAEERRLSLRKPLPARPRSRGEEARVISETLAETRGRGSEFARISARGRRWRSPARWLQRLIQSRSRSEVSKPVRLIALGGRHGTTTRCCLRLSAEAFSRLSCRSSTLRTASAARSRRRTRTATRPSGRAFLPHPRRQPQPARKFLREDYVRPNHSGRARSRTPSSFRAW